MKANHQLVKRLLEARNLNTPLTLQAAIELSPKDKCEAYQVQKAVAHELGWFNTQGPRLWKLGGKLGDPTAAALDMSVLTHHTKREPLVLYVDEACTFTGIELELAVKLKKPLKAGDDLDDAIAAIGETYLALEICDERAEQWQSLPELFQLADHQMNRHIILFGLPFEGWHDELTHIAPVIQLGQDLISDERLTHPQGHPLQALPWLANLSQSLYGQPLESGTIISTGTWAGMQEVSQSKPFSASLEGFQKAEILLTSRETL